MTRVLSEMLGATEPGFHRILQRLEAASGHNSVDIRVSTEIEQATKRKIKELGLDPQDTTGDELYAALQQRVKRDDEHLAAALRSRFGDSSNPNEQVSRVLLSLPISKSCFALQSTVARKLLKSQPPKHTMKALKYRSFDSMLRREPISAVFAAAWLLESASWRKGLLDSYKKLTSSDFEIRQIEILTPNSKHWQELAAKVITQKKHNIIGLKEFGTIVLLPMSGTTLPAATLTTFILALHELNEVRASTTFLKLCQVKPDFGKQVQIVVADEPALNADILDQTVPWQIVQRYYARFADRFRADLFEPHIQREDLSWHSIEKALSHIDPSLDFWHHTTSLGYLHDHQPVSLNIIDVALNYCNQMPYPNRIVHYFRSSLWHELMIHYMKHENVEEAVLGNLETRLVEEPAVV
jgi:hypothetical protein